MNDCNLSDYSGTCWVFPLNCTNVVLNNAGRDCEGTCDSSCNMAKAGMPWYPISGSCPQ